MLKEQSRSKKLAERIIYETFKILKESGGTKKSREVVDEIRKRLHFDEWESHRYEKTGYIRWESILHFFTIDCSKAGLLQKKKGNWILTTEGEEAMKKGAAELFEKATKGYILWKSQQKPEDQQKDIAEIGGETEETIEKNQKALLELYQEQATEGLRNFILGKNPYEFQDMVATLFSAMGYFISHISPRGKDGGIDIIAYNDPLGTKPPRIIVQVKHRPDHTIPSDDIQRLIGTMKRDSDVGIFVTSGEFSNPAKNESRLSGKHVELIDFDRFIELWILYYDKLSDEQKMFLPLQPIYFLGTTE